MLLVAIVLEVINYCFTRSTSVKPGDMWLIPALADMLRRCSRIAAYYSPRKPSAGAGGASSESV